MKLYLLLLFSLSTLFCFAQDSKELDHDYIQEMGKALDGLSDEDINKVLVQALTKQGKNPRKELSKVLMTLSERDQNKVLSYARLAGLKNTIKSTPSRPRFPEVKAESEIVEEPKLRTSIKFDNRIFDFGMVDQGEKIEHIYEFTNTGEHPYTITNAKGSCGCTVPEWPKDPIMPGERGSIRVVFDTKGKKGKQSKIVTVRGNSKESTIRLTVKGEVLAK